jgi:glutaryl-CoA transferase
LKPLDGIKVLDLSRVLAGPWCTQLLADLGADVIKIEKPGSGDDTRHWGPPWHGDGDERVAAYFLSANRGKRSAAIDFSRSEGAALVRRLAADADVVVENFKVGGLRKFGLDSDALRKADPRLIYASITGFGQDGPYADRAGYDYIIQGMGGLMSITGERDDRAGGGPQRVGIAVTDVITGMYAGLAIAAAIAHRERSGEGQLIDLALFDSIVAFCSNQVLGYWCSGRVPVRHGNAHPNIVPYEVFPAADRPIILAVGNDGQFAAFCRVAGRPDLASDPRFRTNPDRVRNRATLVPMVAEIVRARPAGEWVRALAEAGVPCGPVNDLAQVFEDPQAVHRGLKVEIPHPAGVPCPTVASPMRFSATPVGYGAPPPLLGQHTREVLEELLGLSRAQIDTLAAQGAI